MNIVNLGVQLSKSVYESIVWLLPLLIPAFLGTLARAHGLEQKKMSRLQWMSAVFWTTIIGAGLAPLAAHYTGAPDHLVYPIAFLLGILAYEKTNNIATMLKKFRDIKNSVSGLVSSSSEKNDE